MFSPTSIVSYIISIILCTGFAGKDSIAMAKVDMVVDSIEDVIQKAGPYWAAKTDEEKVQCKWRDSNSKSLSYNHDQLLTCTLHYIGRTFIVTKPFYIG